MHGASLLMNGPLLGAHIIKKKERKGTYCAPSGPFMLDAHQAGTGQTRNNRPTVSSFILFLFFEMWGGSRVCARSACSPAWSCITFHSLTNCGPPTMLERNTLTFGLAHRVRERMNVPGPTRWQRVKIDKSSVLRGQAFILMEGTTGG